MKLKLMPFLLGAVALTGSAAAIAFPLISTSVAANNTQGQLVAQAQTPTQGERQGKKDRFAALNLTQAQKDQMKAIRTESRAQTQGIITQAQRDQYKAAIAAGKTKQEARAAMNITPDQKARMKAAKQATKEKMMAVLTEAQRTQLQQMRQSRGQRQG